MSKGLVVYLDDDAYRRLKINVVPRAPDYLLVLRDPIVIPSYPMPMESPTSPWFMGNRKQ